MIAGKREQRDSRLLRAHSQQHQDQPAEEEQPAQIRGHFAGGEQLLPMIPHQQQRDWDYQLAVLLIQVRQPMLPCPQHDRLPSVKLYEEEKYDDHPSNRSKQDTINERIVVCGQRAWPNVSH